VQVDGQANEVLLTDLMTEQYDKFFYITLGFSIALCSFAVYFLVNEVKQMLGGFVAYVTQIWNYIDVMPPIGIFINVTLLFMNL